MSKNIEKIEIMLNDNNGVITAKAVKDAGIPSAYLSIMVERDLLERVGKGFYTLKTTYVDEMFELQSTNPNIIFSHLSALYIHDLTDRTPLKMTITVPRTKNVSSLIKSGMVDVKRSNEKTHLLGLCDGRSPSGFTIKVYDKERTICDIVRNSKNTDAQILTDALKRYASRKDKDLSKLMQYAKILKIEQKVRQYLEVLL